MPYIKREDRQQYENLIAELATQIKAQSQQPGTRAGQMNYVVTKLILAVYGDALRYNDHNEVVGFLECAKQEFYRRATAPYEDSKIKSDGDVY